MNSRVTLDNQSAVVLHHYNYRDSSLIVNFFLRDYGRVSAIAKGIKGKKSKYNHSTLLQPFQKLNVSLIGKGELLTLKDIEFVPNSDSKHESLSGRWPLKGKSLYCAYYLNELLLRLLPSYTDCHAIYELYEQVIDILCHSSEQDALSFEMPLRVFELKLLEYLGYGLNLSYDIHTNLPVDSEKKYYYLIDKGPTESPVIDEQSIMICGKTLLDLTHGQLSDNKTLQESKQLLKWALALHLGDKPLKSREMFKQLFC